jgi:hypothetical protein
VNKFVELGARPFGAERSADALGELARVEQQLGVKLPQDYRDYLIAYAAPILFEHGAKFRPDERTPLADHAGFQSLEILYGPVAGEQGLVHKNQQYREQLAEHITIGEAPGGNQICLSRSGAIYFWHHEAAEGTAFYRIAPSFGDFVARLVADEGEIGSTEGVIESESWLDF